MTFWVMTDPAMWFGSLLRAIISGQTAMAMMLCCRGFLAVNGDVTMALLIIAVD